MAHEGTKYWAEPAFLAAADRAGACLGFAPELSWGDEHPMFCLRRDEQALGPHLCIVVVKGDCGLLW